MSKSRKSNQPTFVDSLYVSRSTGDKVTIRAYRGAQRDSYVIFANGRRVVECRDKAVVRSYIMRNDCHQVESFPKAKTFSQ